MNLEFLNKKKLKFAVFQRSFGKLWGHLHFSNYTYIAPCTYFVTFLGLLGFQSSQIWYFLHFSRSAVLLNLAPLLWKWAERASNSDTQQKAKAPPISPHAHWGQLALDAHMGALKWSTDLGLTWQWIRNRVSLIMRQGCDIEFPPPLSPPPAFQTPSKCSAPLRRPVPPRGAIPLPVISDAH